MHNIWSVNVCIFHFFAFALVMPILCMSFFFLSPSSLSSLPHAARCPHLLLWCVSHGIRSNGFTFARLPSHRKLCWCWRCIGYYGISLSDVEYQHCQHWHYEIESGLSEQLFYYWLYFGIVMFYSHRDHIFRRITIKLFDLRSITIALTADQSFVRYCNCRQFRTIINYST